MKSYKFVPLELPSQVNGSSIAGEIVKDFSLEQPIEITDRLLKNMDSYNQNTPVCVELFMANYNNRKNTGLIKIELTSANKSAVNMLDVSLIQDNKWQGVCFNDFTLKNLSQKPTTLYIKGVNSKVGEAVTVYLRDDSSFKKSILGHESADSLMYRLSTKQIDDMKSIDAKLNIFLLILVMVIFIVLHYQKVLKFKVFIDWLQNDFKSIPIVYMVTAFPLLFILLIYNPPFQSPDEHSHVKKSYMIATGQFDIVTHSGGSSGGYIDTNLHKYILLLRPIHSSREYIENKKNITASKKLYFTNKNIWVQSPGTAYYTPIIYFPQALVMRVSMWLGLSINHTYNLMRIFNIIVIVLIGAIALQILPVGKEFALLILFLPMTLSQTSAAVIDGYLFSLSLLVWALFAYALDRSKDWNLKLSALSWSTLGLLIAVRPSFIIFGVLFLYIELYRKHYRGIPIMISIALLVVLWSSYSISHVVDLRIQRPLDNLELLRNFMNDPSIFINPFFNTITMENFINWYYKPFIGVLGFLDTELPSWLYNSITLFLGITLMIVACKNNTLLYKQKIMIGVVILISAIMIFFLLWLSWTKIDSDIIEGVQGRYFIPIVFGLALVVSGSFFKCQIMNKGLNILFKLIFFIWVCMLYIQLPITLSNKFW